MIAVRIIFVKRNIFIPKDLTSKAIVEAANSFTLNKYYTSAKKTNRCMVINVHTQNMQSIFRFIQQSEH